MKKKIQKTTILCHGERHKFELHPDGRIVSSGCGDITEDVKKVSALARMGRPPSDPESCTGLGAFLTTGLDAIYRRQNNDMGYIDLEQWEAVSIRFEDIKIVKEAEKRIQKAIRREKRLAAKAREEASQ